jgi:ribosomal protein S19E (S16A)
MLESINKYTLRNNTSLEQRGTINIVKKGRVISPQGEA